MRAVVDLGTNSARLLITEGPKAIARDLVITRLGRGVDKTGILSQEGMAAAIQALLRFKEQTAAYNVVPIVVATSAVRDGQIRASLWKWCGGCGLDASALSGGKKQNTRSAEQYWPQSGWPWACGSRRYWRRQHGNLGRNEERHAPRGR